MWSKKNLICVCGEAVKYKRYVVRRLKESEWMGKVDYAEEWAD